MQPILITVDANVYSNDDYQIFTAGMNACSNIGFRYMSLSSHRNGMKLLRCQFSDEPYKYPLSEAPSLNAMLR